MEEDDSVTPPKIALLSDLKGKVSVGRVPKPGRKSARPKPVGKNPKSGFLEDEPNENDLAGFDEGPVKRKKKKENEGPPRPQPVFKPGREADKKARQPTLSRMRNIALYQVSQRELSTQGLRDILTRRMIRWLSRLESESAAEHKPLIEADMERIVKEMVDQKMIDDARYAEMKVRGWRGQGWGERRIEMELRKKGIGSDLAQDALKAVDEEIVDIEDEDVRRDESERISAERLAEKKRIGPYRRNSAPEDRNEAAKLWRREAGVLARAGFGMDIIHDILSRPPEEEEF